MPRLDENNETVSAPIRENTDAGRIAWLKHQVAPAVRDMLVRGVIDYEDLLEIFEVTERQLSLPLD